MADQADSPDTLIAVATPPGRSGRGMVRLSGPAVDPVIARRLPQPLPPRQPTPSRLRLSDGATIPCLALRFFAPHSYTCDDVLELQVPGNPALLERVLHDLLAEPGVRLAEPGEFTRRAFFAGRIDLTRAEGIAATISAVSDAQLEAARLLRHGRLGQWSVELVEQLAQVLALVEAGIDFVDQEDVVPIAPRDLLARLREIDTRLHELTDRSRTWAQLEALPRVVLAGRPNVGKSTLFNALLGHERAVASDVAGTTRDVLAEPLRIDGPDGEAEVMLVDVAGLDEAAETLEESMQSAAGEAIASADLVLLLDDGVAADGAANHSNVLENIRITFPAHAAVVAVRTKADTGPPRAPGATDVAVSAATGEGLGALRAAIADRLAGRAVSLSGQALALQPRHTHALREAGDAVVRALRWVEPQADRSALDDVELIALEMRVALDHLGQLGGRVSPDDVIGRVFATFCVGK